MAYTAEKPRNARSSDELRQSIHGWGVDLDPKDRPAVPKERFNLDTGAHWHFPERQPELRPRERSIEHKFLTPVFGTSCPPKGASGAIRRYAYRKYSEASTAHWLLLMAADRVDVLESRVTAILSGHPDNPIAESGIRSEFTHGGLRSRVGQHRADLKHQPLDLVLAAAPWVLVGAIAYTAGRAVLNGGRRDSEDWRDLSYDREDRRRALRDAGLR